MTNATFSYQWMYTPRDGSVSNDSEYTPVSNYESHSVWVRVTYTDDDGHEESLYSDYYGPVAPSRTKATGAPAITGAARVGETLTVDTSGIADGDGLANVSYSYRWISNGGTWDSYITDATDSTYTLLAADEGKTLKVQVSFTDDAGFEETLTSAATVAVAVAATTPGEPHSVDVQPSGTGRLLVSWQEPVSNGGSDVTGYKVQWKLSSGSWNTPEDVSEATATATSHTIASLQLDVEYALRVIATNTVGDGPASDVVNATPVAQSSQQQAATQNTPATGQPSISGTVQVGETLTASTSSIADVDGVTNATFSYQWIRNDGGSDADIQNATGSTYTLVSGDETKTIKVRVSFSDDAGNSESLTSVATAAVEAGYTSHDRPHGLQGTALAGTITLIWQDPDTHTTYNLYQILRHRPELGEAEPLIYVDYAFINDRTFVDSEVEPGVLYVYAVTAVKDPFGYLGPASSPFEVRVPDTESANSPAGGAPTITGTLRVSETLAADTSSIADADGVTNATFSYQWIRNDGSSDTDIQGATGSGYTLVDADAGSTVKVWVSFTDDAGNNETLTSAATAAVSAVVPGAPGSLEVQPSGTGRLAVSWEEPASNGGATVTGYTVKWKEAAGSWDTEADVSSTTTTDTSHTISGLSLGTEYSVRVIATNSIGDGPASAEETATAVAQTSQQQAATQNNPATGAPTINGTPEVGQTLSVDTSSISDADGLANVAFSYQWVRNDGGTDTDLLGQTAQSTPSTP